MSDIKEVDVTKFKVYYTKQSHLYSIMFKLHIGLLLVEIQLLSKTLLHYVTLNSNMH